MKNHWHCSIWVMLLLWGTMAFAQTERVEPPPPTEKCEPFLWVAEQMPQFPSCAEDTATYSRGMTCTQAKLHAFVFQNLNFSNIDRPTKGVVVVACTINKEGRLVDIELRKDIGGGAGEAVLKMMRQLQARPTPWTPGKQGGHAVSVRLNVPIKIKVE